ncbi:hypothetical protein B0H12DRAFT_1238933 [Mycena haematopus]|nr:hypothetical protein B0H12DRAFT_1238933 [Mycena haematopus]
MLGPATELSIDSDEFVGIGNPDTTLILVTNACSLFLAPVADAFIIYRTFHVWHRNWLVIILPVVLFLANLGSSIWGMIALSTVELSPTIWSNVVFKSLNLFISLTLCTNIICTALISFRILRVHRQIIMSSNFASTHTMRAVSAIVESAAIYTLLLVSTLISNNRDSFVILTLIECTPPTIGLVFAYIIVRVSRGTSYEESENVASGTSIYFRNAHDHPTYELDGNPVGVPGPTVQVRVRLERETETQAACTSYGSHIDKHAEEPVV